MSVSTLAHKEWYAWIGQKVCVNKKDIGTLKYFGEIKSKSGFWCGVEFNEPIGVTDGAIFGIQYFKCKAKCGVFAPLHEVKRYRSRSTEFARLSDLPKLKAGESSNAALKKQAQPKKSLGSLSATLDRIKNKPGISFKTIMESENKYVNVRKRSKNGRKRVGTEESLGILSNLLEEDSSWNLLDSIDPKKSLIKDSDDSLDDCVFSPQLKSLLPNFKPLAYQKQFDNQVPFDIKCASTPKPGFKNIFNLGATVRLEDYSFQGEVEPIIAGSNATKSMDLDLTNFKQSEILCSTSKLTIPILSGSNAVKPMDLDVSNFKPSEILCSTSKLTIPIVPNESQMPNEIFFAKNDEPECNENINDSMNIENNGSYVQNKVASDNLLNKTQYITTSEATNVLNATYEIPSDQLNNPTTQSKQDANQNFDFQPRVIGANKISNDVVDLNSTFVLLKDSPVKELQADKTFVLEHTLVKQLQGSSSVESEFNFEKKSLSIIFENTLNENNSVFEAVECAGGDQSISSFQDLGAHKNLSRLKISSENIDKFEKVFNAPSKMVDKEQNVSDLNSTFAIISDVKGKDNVVPKNISKRYSLSSISTMKNIPSQSRKCNILDNKGIKPPQSFNNAKTTFKAPAANVSTIKTKIMKDSTLAVANKKTEAKDKTSGDTQTSKLSSKDNFKTISSSSNMSEPSRRNSIACKSSKQKENELLVTLKITERNTKIIARRQSVGGAVTKVTSKVSYTSNRKSISGSSNIDLKANSRAQNMNGFNSSNRKSISGSSNIDLKANSKAQNMNGFTSTNLTNEKKHEILKRRHTMLPSVSASGMPDKRDVVKSKSDLSSYASNAATTSRDSNRLQSSNARDGFGDKKENARNNIIKKHTQVERIKEHSPRVISPRLGSKQPNEKLMPRRELLKPGTISRLPVAAKSIKKPGFLTNGVKA